MLSAGARLGPYEVVSPLGAGGMGEVYRARDTKLGREVALKVLPEGALDDDEARRRFRKEADALARLAHPHIATIHDFDSADGTDFLVMELVRGPSLRDEIEEKGALPEKTVVRLGAQLARGLQAAHKEGIVHRDLKPSNVQLTPDGLAKILDFGLAQLLPREAAGEETAPTETAIGKAAGTLLYMSPEQLRGRGVDSRTDLYAAGAVLYEMATGRPLFSRPSTAELTDSILNEEPRPPRELNERITPGLEAVILKALDKDPELRHQTAKDLLVDLERLQQRTRSSVNSGLRTSRHEPTAPSHDPHPPQSATAAPSDPSAPAPDRTPSQRPLWQYPATIALLILATAFAAAWVAWSLHPVRHELVQFTIEVPRKNGWRSGPGAALSPDGRSLAYVSPNEAGEDVIWIRPLDSLTARPLEGTEGAQFPFWSPDGRSLGFFADRSLKRIAATGGAPQKLAATAPYSFGASWNEDDVIVFSPGMRSPLYRVSAKGGEARPVTTLDAERGHGAHTSPSFLPDQRHFVFTVSAPQGQGGIYLGSLDSPEMSRLVGLNSPAVGTRDGFLVFIEGGLVRAQELDLDRAELAGERVTVAEGAYFAPREVYSDAMSLSVGANGSLAFRQGTPNRRRLTWFDRSGTRLGTVGPEGTYDAPVLSPDGTRVAVGRDGDIWIIELTRGGAEYPLTQGPANDFYPLWSPDGQYVAYSSGSEANNFLYRKLASGTGQPELLFDGLAVSPFSWSRGYITFFTTNSETHDDDIYVLPVEGDGKPIPFLATEVNEHESHLSPDGRWMAFVTEESGQPEVYVQTFPAGEQRWRISPAGGVQPIWRADGQELFVLRPDGTLMALPIQTRPTFEAGDPKPLFPTNAQVWAARNSYSPTRDGQRFLVNVDPGITVWKTAVVLNWREALADQ